jgi:transcriptional regulator with XRE-family HTH domain
VDYPEEVQEMGKFVSRARKLRLEYATKLGRDVPLQEVADAIEVDRRSLAKIEQGKLQRPNMEIMEKLASFYTTAGLDATNILEYNPEAMQRASPAAVLMH